MVLRLALLAVMATLGLKGFRPKNVKTKSGKVKRKCVRKQKKRR
jgi:hypothetical protein